MNLGHDRHANGWFVGARLDVGGPRGHRGVELGSRGVIQVESRGGYLWAVIGDYPDHLRARGIGRALPDFRLSAARTDDTAMTGRGIGLSKHS